MVQQENELSIYLSKILENDFAKVANFSINLNYNNHQIMSPLGQNPTVTFYGPQTARLEVIFYIDQSYKGPVVVLISELERGMRHFCQRCGATFQNRSMDPNMYRNDKVSSINYVFNLHDYGMFIDGVTKMGLEQMDREFTKALEEKLSED